MPVSQVQLMGNITNVEMTVNNTGSAFIRGSLAVSQGKDANGEDKETLWFNLKAWGDLAENIAETYQNTVNAGGKSFRAIVVGRVVPEKWEDSNGNSRESTCVYLEDLGVSLRWAQVGSINKASNPQNSNAFNQVKKASEIEPPASANKTAEENMEENGVPF
jgi:single stranded DNA-binding protein|tara:strand:+ start:68 stop:553 length:486 start_codon:yes stop_codon:yes gene_type:complete